MTTQEHVNALPETGGYFELDLPDYGDMYPEAIRFQSGRAAIRAALECNGISRVMMPAYICVSVIQAGIDAGMAIDLYDLDESLYPKNLPRSLPKDCALIYVNYFGLCKENVLRLHDELPGWQLIIDNSQALFDSYTDALATVYSPRKFVGLPDGGLLVASPELKIVPPEAEDRESISRIKYMLVRMAYSAREGYTDSIEARNSLRDIPPLAMSRLTQRLMKSVPWRTVIGRRRENYAAMAEMLDTINQQRWQFGEDKVPLCYPLVIRGHEVGRIKKELAALNVFTPTYWPDFQSRVRAGTIEEAFFSDTLFLPIDQRMDLDRVEAVGELVLELIK